MKAETKAKLLEAWQYCDDNDKSTEFMLQYMQDVAGVDLDCVINFIQKYSKKAEAELCTIPSVRCSVIRFAWSNENLKTWFITKTAKAFLPKGSRLLFKMGCEPTKDPISITDTQPRRGNIINDVDGDKLKVVNVEWC